MKNKSLIALTLMIGMSACQKANSAADSSTTVEAQIAANSKYELDLQTNSSRNTQITSQATNALSSKVVNVPLSGTAIYQYVPDSNFVGTDSVIVVVGGGNRGGCKDKSGSPSSGDVAKTTYKIRIKVGTAVTN